MENKPSITIIFDAAALTPENIFLNGSTDKETAKLKEISKLMTARLEDRHLSPFPGGPDR